MNNKYPLIVTHDEGFHVDEVFAIALLAKLAFGAKDLNELEIIRTRNEKDIKKFMEKKNTYVIDVGRIHDETQLLFDHHQNDPNLKWEESDKIEDVNYNGTPFLLSACGLIWKYLIKNKKNFQTLNTLSEEKIELLNYFVKWVDVCDNGVAPWKYAPLFFAYNPIGKANAEREYAGFRKAIVEAGNFIENIIKCHEGYVSCLYGNRDPGTPYYHVINNFMSKIIYEKMEELTEEEEIKFQKLFEEKYNDMLMSYYVGFLMADNNSWKMKQSALQIIDNIIAIVKAEAIAESEIRKALKIARQENHKDVLFFKDDNYNARQLTNQYSSDGLICATYYSEKDTWSITLINKTKEDPYTGRIQMPAQWAGLEGEELSEKSGFDNMVFAHKGRFIVVMKGSKQDCLAVCNKIIALS